MTNPSKGEVDQARSTIKEVTSRARSDQSYMSQLQDDPVGTLLAAGLPAGAVVDILAEEGMEPDEVQGFLAIALPGTLSTGFSPTLGGTRGGLAAEGCSGAFSCLCASGGGCCFTGKGSTGLPGGLGGTTLR